MIVADTSIISYLIIPGEFTDDVLRVRSTDSEWIAPQLWLSEFRSVLRKYIVSGVLTTDEAVRYVDLAEELMEGRSYTVSSRQVLTLVSASGKSSYDCEFVALAELAHVPLVTTDKAILRAFPDTAVHPSRFAPRT